MTATLVMFADRQLAEPPPTGAKHQTHKNPCPNTVACERTRKESEKGKEGRISSVLKECLQRSSWTSVRKMVHVYSNPKNKQLVETGKEMIM